jgi:vacuolar-type H+-ATPase subunit E/Vma4
VAIEDIVSRIEDDAQAEGEARVIAARRDAALLVAQAGARAEARSAHEIELGRVRAEREAATVVAGARLAARDASLMARQEIDREALTRLEAALTALPDDRYAALLAREIASAPLPAGVLRLGSADGARLRTALPSALKAAGLALTIDDAPADIERGVVLVGDRVRIEVSPASLIFARRADLESAADRALFGKG